MSTTWPRLGILYEHPEWFVPLFAELDRRGVPYARIHAADLAFDPADRRAPYDLVVNRMSPSAYVRGHGHAIFASLAYLQWLESVGVPVVNGAAAFALELSKAAQVALLARLGLPHPRTRVVNTARQAAAAARELAVPVLVKPNIGGSGAGIRRFDRWEDLDAAARAGTLDLGIDRVALVQEYHAPADGHIVRVEVLDGRFLYAIKVFPDPGAGFNLCPADICQTDGTGAPAAPPQTAKSAVDLCPVDLPKTNLRVEGYRPPAQVLDEVQQIAAAARLDVGGIEYLVSQRDGRRYYYDINVLSNFVTDARRVVGFDPYAVFADFLERRLGVIASPVTA
ncbi:MAG: hypothetical protein QN183_00690 [Armatimonadota bacterium]|nr:hypothetical protein [Armatimonadota bacterium]MDR7486158.1 hypothetical protein [Armatimonadota bacterium]MDR7531789.1 hypothetical protein [Armatimonadota bacterium]MDR7534866.1 hypothetical protein [Armatimonadota bacterium]